ncbi:MAG: transposase, partial [Colwellia sp.]|nr:transposase [Colwellia sp.]
LLSRLNISPDNWLTLTKDFRRLFHGAVGHGEALAGYCERKGLKRRTNVSCCDNLLT